MTPFPPPRDRLTYAVKAAELTQRAATAPILDRHGLSYPQLSLLLTILRQPGVSTAELARFHGITPQSAGEIVAVLIRRGAIERAPDADQPRRMAVTLTATGQSIMDDACAMLDVIDAQLTQGLSEAELAMARHVLATIVRNGRTVHPALL